MFREYVVVLVLLLNAACRVNGQSEGGESSGCFQDDVPSTMRCDVMTRGKMWEVRHCTCRSNCQLVKLRCDFDGKWRPIGQSPCDMLTFNLMGTGGLNISFDHGNFSFSCVVGSTLTSYIGPVMCRDGKVVGRQLLQVPRCENKGEKTDHPDIKVTTETTSTPQIPIIMTTITKKNEKITTTPIYNSSLKYESTTIGNNVKSSTLSKNSKEITEVNIIIILISSLLGLFIIIIFILFIIWLSRKYQCCLKKSGYIDADEIQNRPKYYPEIPVRYQRPINPFYLSVRASSNRVDSLKPIEEGEEEHIYDVIGEPIYDDVGPPGS